MADQTFKLMNDSGSAERVAFDLMSKVMYMGPTGTYTTKQQIIDLYVDCLWAVKNHDRNGGR